MEDNSSADAEHSVLFYLTLIIYHNILSNNRALDIYQLWNIDSYK